MIRRSVGCLLLGGLLLAPGAVRAQQVQTARTGGVQFGVGGSSNALVTREYLSLTVFAGYGGTYRPGHWTPVDVIVHATVPRDMTGQAGTIVRGTLRVTIQTGVAEQERHEREVEVPVQGERRVSFVLLPEGDTVRVEFDPVREDWIRAQAVGTGIEKVIGIARMRIGTDNRTFVGTFGANERALRRVVGHPGTRGLEIALLTPADALGAPAGWFGLDVLVLTLKELSALPPDVQDGVIGWVRSGGHLVLTYAGPYSHLAGDIEAALPARLSLSRQMVAGAELEALGETPLPAEGRTFIAVDQVEPRGDVLLRTSGAPLVTRRRLDSGTIVLVGANIAAAPFVEWDGLSRVWALALPKGMTPESGGMGILTEVLEAFLGFRDISAAGLSGVLLAFAVYAVLIGGGLAWGLRRAERVHWYWQAVGGTVLVVLLVTMANPAVLSLNLASVRTISVLHSRSGAAVGRIETFAVATSHVERDIDLAIGVPRGGFRVFPVERPLSRDTRTQLVGYDGDPVAHACVAGSRTASVALGTAPATPVPALDFVFEGNGRYRVRNRTGATLSFAGVAVPEGFVELHNLQPGSEVGVQIPGDPRFRRWADFQAIQLFGGLIPAFLDALPQAVDVPGAMYPTMLTPAGARAFGAHATEPTLMAWWPLAAVAADTGTPAALLQGHTLLVVRPEGV